MRAWSFWCTARSVASACSILSNHCPALVALGHGTTRSLPPVRDRLYSVKKRYLERVVRACSPSLSSSSCHSEKWENRTISKRNGTLYPNGTMYQPSFKNSNVVPCTNVVQRQSIRIFPCTSLTSKFSMQRDGAESKLRRFVVHFAKMLHECCSNVA
jgi:hypothetical protein